MPCALRVAKMVEPSPIRAGAWRAWKRLSALSSASALGVNGAPPVDVYQAGSELEADGLQNWSSLDQTGDGGPHGLELEFGRPLNLIGAAITVARIATAEIEEPVAGA